MMSTTIIETLRESARGSKCRFCPSIADSILKFGKYLPQDYLERSMALEHSQTHPKPPKSTSNRPQIDPKSIPNPPKIDSGGLWKHILDQCFKKDQFRTFKRWQRDAPKRPKDTPTHPRTLPNGV